MIEGLPGLIAIGVVATAGFLMARSFGARRRRTGSSHDGSSGYWSSSDTISSTREADRDGVGWFSGFFSSSDTSSSSSDSGGSSDSSGSSDSGSSDSGGGGGDGGGGGGGGD